MSFEKMQNVEETSEQKLGRKKEALMRLESTVENIKKQIEKEKDQAKIDFLLNKTQALEVDIEDLRSQILEDEENDDISGLTF